MYYFQPQPIIDEMQEEWKSFDRAINRVVHYWDDKVSEAMQTTCIGELANVGHNTTNVMIQYSKKITDLIEEMEYYANR